MSLSPVDIGAAANSQAKKPRTLIASANADPCVTVKSNYIQNVKVLEKFYDSAELPLARRADRPAHIYVLTPLQILFKYFHEADQAFDGNLYEKLASPEVKEGLTSYFTSQIAPNSGSMAAAAARLLKKVQITRATNAIVHSFTNHELDLLTVGEKLNVKIQDWHTWYEHIALGKVTVTVATDGAYHNLVWHLSNPAYPTLTEIVSDGVTYQDSLKIKDSVIKAASKTDDGKKALASAQQSLAGLTTATSAPKMDALQAFLPKQK